MRTLAKRSGNGLEARMAFCWHTRVLSTSYAVLDELQGPDDPRFGWMIQSLTRELFPQREAHQRDRLGLLLD